jgi:hypothetical protein
MEDLIKTSEYVSILTTPSRLERGNPNTFGGVLRDTATLYTTRGERFPPSTTLDCKIDSEAFILAATEFIDERAAKEMKTEFGGIVEDIHTKPPVVTVGNYATYDMNDLSFNLTPRRSCFLEPNRKALPEPTYLALADILDTKCSRGEGCYYKTNVFPHVESVGPVALSSWVSSLFTCFLPSCINTQHIEEIGETLVSTLTELTRNSSMV